MTMCPAISINPFEHCDMLILCYIIEIAEFWHRWCSKISIAVVLPRRQTVEGMGMETEDSDGWQKV